MRPNVRRYLRSQGPRLTAAMMFTEMAESASLGGTAFPLVGIPQSASAKLTDLHAMLIKLSHTVFLSACQAHARAAAVNKAVVGIQRWFAALHSHLAHLADHGDAFNALYFVRVFVDMCTADEHVLRQIRNRHINFSDVIHAELANLVCSISHACLPQLRNDILLLTLQIHAIGDAERELQQGGGGGGEEEGGEGGEGEEEEGEEGEGKKTGGGGRFGHIHEGPVCHHKICFSLVL